MADAGRALEACKTWVADIVVGLWLCPFARSVVEDGSLRWAIASGNTFASLLVEVESEIERLSNHRPEQISTTLIVIPGGMEELEDFLDLVDLVDRSIEARHVDDFVQTASFHPAYRFRGEPDGDVSHFTNRSPYPMIHLLRVASVSRAVELHPDTNSIPSDNVARLRSKGLDAVQSLWRAAGWKPVVQELRVR